MGRQWQELGREHGRLLDLEWDLVLSLSGRHGVLVTDCPAAGIGAQNSPVCLDVMCWRRLFGIFSLLPRE